MATTVIQAASRAQQTKAAQRGAAALSAGQLVGFATETVYGVAALANIPQAMERLRELKNRPSRPFSVHLATPQDAELYVADIPVPAQRLMAKAWPGPLTLLLPVGGQLAEERFTKAGLYDVLCWQDTIGLRCPDLPLAREMLAAVDWPVVAPSANLPGAPSPRNAKDVLEALEGRIDLLIDSGPTRYGADSTIVAVEGDSWRIVRQGVYGERQIARLMRRTILFVCTGNTCRSPLAVALSRKMLAERLGTTPGKLPEAGWEILSAGVWAADDLPASPVAIQAAGELGADLTGHRSRKLTKDLIDQADMVFCMSNEHVAAVVELLPTSAGKVRRLSPREDISDPAGGPAEVYRRTAKKIQQALHDILGKELHENRTRR
ncbi:MAG: L-threonylcarbamoyladenylate synthase [Phycisphaerae bacterium]|jgi:tRNA threonylcarbamoyl adenosine modification protein (Sua5/YciO/YrdC/YwlC family)